MSARTGPEQRGARRATLLRCLLVIGSCVSLPLASAHAQVPGQVSFQGLLLDAGGAPLNAIVDLQFSLFDAPTGGVSLWSESHTAVSVTDGLYDVQLGSTTPLGAALSSGGTRYLEVSVSGETLTPRRPLLSVPYALVAGRLPSLDALHGTPCSASNPLAGTTVVAIQTDGTVKLSCSNVYTLGVTVQAVGGVGPSAPVTSSPPGLSCSNTPPTDCSEPYVGGTVVTLTATNNASYLFTGWSGACTGTGACVLTMDGNKAVTASFQPNF